MDSTHTNKGFVPDKKHSLTPIVENGKEIHSVDMKKKGGGNDGAYNPYNQRIVAVPISNADAVFHILKGSLGTGLLAMPNAFRNSGYIVGLVCTIIIGIICTYNVHLLLRSVYEICKRKKMPSLTYPGAAELAMLEGPPFFHKLAPIAPHVVNIFLLIYQLGSCAVYIIFIATNVKSVVDQYTADAMSLAIYMVIFLLPLILLNYIRNLKLLAPFSTGANAVTAVSFGFLLYYMITDGPTIENREPAGELMNFPLYFGTVLFALEAIGVILPVENKMKTPKFFGGTIGVLNISMSVVITLYTILGLLGYLTYGDNVQGTITLNMPDNEIPAQVIRILYAFAIFITYGIQFYVAIEIAWDEYGAPWVTNDKWKLFWEYVMRTSLVLLTFALAVAVPALHLFISLFGAFCLSAIGIAIPATIDMATFWYARKGYVFYISLIKNILLIIFGLMGLVAGTFTSLRDIIIEFS